VIRGDSLAAAAGAVPEHGGQVVVEPFTLAGTGQG
jgi:hypothetical protein